MRRVKIKEDSPFLVPTNSPDTFGKSVLPELCRKNFSSIETKMPFHWL